MLHRTHLINFHATANTPIELTIRTYSVNMVSSAFDVHLRQYVIQIDVNINKIHSFGVTQNIQLSQHINRQYRWYSEKEEKRGPDM